MMLSKALNMEKPLTSINAIEKNSDTSIESKLSNLMINLHFMQITRNCKFSLLLSKGKELIR